MHQQVMIPCQYADPVGDEVSVSPPGSEYPASEDCFELGVKRPARLSGTQGQHSAFPAGVDSTSIRLEEHVPINTSN